jgi:pimeloyl-ACP methyl ester carboxylesterase
MIMERRKLKKDPIFRGEGIPKFDNQPIVIIPGLIGIKPGRRAFSEWLQRIGCVPFMAEIGPKELTSESILGKIDKAVDKAYEATGKKPVLVGYSVGSMEAVYYANRHKDKIEKIITLGGPKTDSFEVHFLLDGLLQVVAGLGTGRKAMADFIHEAIMPPKVPTFSIYSKDDGIVNWKKCLIPNGDNREIHGGHLSMLGNAEVYRNIVEILGKS